MTDTTASISERLLVPPPTGDERALAAIERVRAVHVRDEYGLCVACSWEYPDASYDAISNDVAWPCPTIAALDGAPEPEWEYGYTEHGMNPMRGCQDLATARACASGMQEKVVRRRKAGPWVLVESEEV